MMKTTVPFLTLLLLGGCASVPSGPDVAVMPGPGKSFEQFAQDDSICRSYADRSIGNNVNNVGANNVVTGAAVGTALGAGAGALLGGNHEGAEMGAGAGLLTGTAVGMGNANASQGNVQRRYDIAYEQCMYAKGHQLPPASTTTTYYGGYYGGYRGRPVTIYQAPPTTVIMQAPPAQPAYAPPPPPPSAVTPPPPPGR
jgi:hypothetical protein